MRTFRMVRHGDESGVSGIGHVLDGIEFKNGQVVVSWLSSYSSIGVYPSFEEFKKIHIDSHPTNETEIIWSEDDDNFS